MNPVLLLGAGFSRNWGGWLANEAFEYLLGCPQIDAGTRELLWRHRRSGGFESALAELQQEYLRRKDSLSEQRLGSLQEPIIQMFADMDKAFARVNFEFQNDLEFMVRSFLVRFDAIFTLNQDLLMERHYLDGNVGFSSYRRWSGWLIPGMKPMPSVGLSLAETNTGRWMPDSSTQIIQGGFQPYIKLHGSSNWTDATGKQLLVMGGNKVSIIDQYPILKWNHDQLKQYLSRPDTRLMVIGYSFGDSHINQIIGEAADRGTIRMFIVDPLGLDVIDENRHSMLYAPGPLVTRLGSHVIGASRRSLREIFGGDRVEHAKVMRFFS